ncbi:hypothetical protein [Glutamicibacter arilaitensis]|uniref:hypothetical protein n=1 Tax=Glutamicibacter arilaitensis TaxID=256701 RepID=UPI0018691C09|nr:hypothetical protein [Glutamicibacter arilaitensis]
MGLLQDKYRNRVNEQLEYITKDLEPEELNGPIQDGFEEHLASYEYDSSDFTGAMVVVSVIFGAVSIWLSLRDPIENIGVQVTVIVTTGILTLAAILGAYWILRGPAAKKSAIIIYQHRLAVWSSSQVPKSEAGLVKTGVAEEAEPKEKDKTVIGAFSIALGFYYIGNGIKQLFNKP